MNKVVYTVDELVEILNTNRSRVYVLIDTGVLQAFRLGRKWLVTEKNLQFFLENYGNYDVSNADACIKSRILVEQKMKNSKELC